jgi:biopolymer transport protein ExbD
MRFSTEHKTINTFHFSAALNVIMLLLVFIVMVFAFYSKSGIHIKLTNRSYQNLDGNSKNVVKINQLDKIFIGQEEITSDKLLERLSSLKKDNFFTLIVQPDKSTKFITFVNVINTAKKAGINNIAVHTELASY